MSVSFPCHFSSRLYKNMLFITWTVRNWSSFSLLISIKMYADILFNHHIEIALHPTKNKKEKKYIYIQAPISFQFSFGDCTWCGDDLKLIRCHLCLYSYFCFDDLFVFPPHITLYANVKTFKRKQKNTHTEPIKI